MQGKRRVAARWRAILAGVKIRTAGDAPLVLSAARPALLAPATLERSHPGLCQPLNFAKVEIEGSANKPFTERRGTN
jgi:hypothetical protein